MIEAQTPAEGISVQDVWDDAIVYNISCTCTDPDHELITWIEVTQDADQPEVEATFYVRTNFDNWDNIWERVRIACGVLFGYGYEQNHTILLSKQSAINFASALNNSVTVLEERELDNKS